AGQCLVARPCVGAALAADRRRIGLVRDRVQDGLSRGEQVRRLSRIGVVQDLVVQCPRVFALPLVRVDGGESGYGLHVVRVGGEIVPVAGHGVVPALGRVIYPCYVEQGVPLLLCELRIIRRRHRELEVLRRRVRLIGVGEQRPQVDEARRLAAVDRVGAPEARDSRIGVPRLPRLDAFVEHRDPENAAPAVDVVLAGGCQRQRLSEGRVGAREVVLQSVIAGQVVPRGRILLLAAGGKRLVQHLVRVLQVLRPLVHELGLRGALQVKHPAVHEVMLGVEVAPGALPLLRGQGPAHGSEPHGDDHGHGSVDGHAHSLDLATSASASRSAARAISSAGRPSARAAASTSSYSDLTRTPPASGCSSTFTRTATSGESWMVTWRRGNVARSATQRRTPAVVLCRNSAAVTASASSSGAITSTRNPERPFFICTGHVCTSSAPALTSACRNGSTYSGLMSSTSVASSTTRPASAACSARSKRSALG